MLTLSRSFSVYKGLVTATYLKYKKNTYTGWSKKRLWIDLEEKCLRNSKNVFWWSLSLYMFTSTQEVRA